MSDNIHQRVLKDFLKWKWWSNWYGDSVPNRRSEVQISVVTVWRTCYKSQQTTLIFVGRDDGTIPLVESSISSRERILKYW